MLIQKWNEFHWMYVEVRHGLKAIVRRYDFFYWSIWNDHRSWKSMVQHTPMINHRLCSDDVIEKGILTEIFFKNSICLIGLVAKIDSQASYGKSINVLIWYKKPLETDATPCSLLLFHSMPVISHSTDRKERIPLHVCCMWLITVRAAVTLHTQVPKTWIWRRRIHQIWRSKNTSIKNSYHSDSD